MPPDELPPEPADMPRFRPPDRSGVAWSSDATGPEVPPPPPLRTASAVPVETEQASTGRGWVVAVFSAVVVLPTLFFLYMGLRPQGNATESAGGAIAVLVGIEVVVGAAFAGSAWWTARRPVGQARSTGLRVVLTLAGLWGLVTGFLGGISITMTRNPNLDDA